MIEVGSLLHPEIHKECEYDGYERIHKFRARRMFHFSKTATFGDMVDEILSESDEKGQYGKIFLEDLCLVHNHGGLWGSYYTRNDRTRVFVYGIAITHQDPTHVCYRLYPATDEGWKSYKADIAYP